MPSTPHGYIRQESDIEDPSDSDDESDVYDDGPSGDFVDPSMVQKDGFCQRLCRCLCPRRKVKETGFRLVRTDDRRTNRPIVVDEDGEMKFLRKVSNVVASTKYTVMSFVPMVFAQQFKFFFNFFFLVLAVTQSLPPLRVGPLFTYIGPLVFVLLCTMLKEASDDIKRWRRDKAVNSKKYTRVNTAVGDLEKVASADIKVGDVLQVLTNERVPADMILLRTEFGEQEGKNGQTYIRTDQLDGEKDWKPRKAPSLTQDLEGWRDLCGDVQICAKVEAPQMSIYKFLGRLSLRKLGDNDVQSEALGLENTLWANTVVTHGPVYGLVVYTGVDSRTVMSYDDNASDDKTCLLDKQVDFCAKVCFAVLIGLSFMLVLCRGLRGQWWIFLLRYIVLLSYIIPISLRVNLDMAKTLYASRIGSDSKIPGTVARNSAIVEDLGTIDYVLTDKTGTLTKNDMVFKKLRVPAGEYSSDADTQQISMMITRVLRRILSARPSPGVFGSRSTGQRGGKEEEARGLELLIAIVTLALCHNVTPVETAGSDDWTLQAPSPDEAALVKYARECGIKLIRRDDDCIILECLNITGRPQLRYDIVECLPFSSDRKRMGILVKEEISGQYMYLMKGADSVMIPRVAEHGKKNAYMEEVVDDYACHGLRTLVVAMKRMTREGCEEFEAAYKDATLDVSEQREEKLAEIVDRYLETNLELVCLTGVEDMLQDDVAPVIESLRVAKIKVWMLTGDKIDTAICIAISTALKSPEQSLLRLEASHVHSAIDALADLREARNAKMEGLSDTVVVIDGTVLAMVLSTGLYTSEFVELIKDAPAVVCCRCSPSQKSEVVRAIKKYDNGQRTLAIGDGGNDVGMIQAADVGVGIVGKEGMQASLAADFSILEFRSLHRLLLWHGRNCYLQSARMSLFVIHRGLVIAVMQVIFSAMFYFIALPLFQGWLMIGYSTYYTTAPVFSLCLYTDLEDTVVYQYPELYAISRRGRQMSLKAFLGWVWKSVYQGSAIMVLTVILFGNELITSSLVAVAFTSLVISELLNVASEVHPNWHPLMIVAELLSIVIYVYSIFILRSNFDLDTIFSIDFLWKVAVITAVSWIPVHAWKQIRRCCCPPHHRKLLRAYARNGGRAPERTRYVYHDPDNDSVELLATTHVSSPTSNE